MARRAEPPTDIDPGSPNILGDPPESPSILYNPLSVTNIAPILADDNEASSGILHQDSNDAAIRVSQNSEERHEESSSSRPMSPDSDLTEEPPAKIPRYNDESDGKTCSICLEVWDSSGTHRLVALKCGHLFGHSCIEKWLLSQTVKNRICPTCKGKASVADIRFLYASTVLARDTSELTALQKEVVALRDEKCRVEVEFLRLKMVHQACLEQLHILKKKCSSQEKLSKKHYRFALEKNLEVSKDGGCRVLAYNCRTYEWFVSQKSTNNIFPGYGVRKVSCVDHKLGQFIHLHPKPIRDFAYSQPLDLLLSVALDGSARVLQRGIPNMSIQSGAPLWSCTWDILNENYLYIGGIGGKILHYDIRHSSSPLKALTCPGDVSQVVSLHSTQFGLLSCQLNSSWLWSPDFEPSSLPVDGPFMSLTFDSDTNKVLLFCRPGNSNRSRLNICQLKYSNSTVLCDVVKVCSGTSRASVMSRACFIQAGESRWVAAHSESEAMLQLYGLDNETNISLPASEPALDVSAAHLNSDTLLGALSENRLRIYKAVQTS